MTSTNTIEKISSLFGNTKTVQQLSQQAVQLIMQEMENRGLVATSIYRINDAHQTMEAFAYAIKGGKRIDAMLPQKFSQLALPLNTKENLTIAAALDNKVKQSNTFADFSRGAVPDSIASAIQKLLGGTLTIGVPVSVNPRKNAGTVLFMFDRPSVGDADMEMMRAFARQIGRAFASITSQRRIADSHSREVDRRAAQKDVGDMATVRFTLRISPNQDTKLTQLAQKQDLPKAEVLRQLIDEK